MINSKSKDLTLKVLKVFLVVALFMLGEVSPVFATGCEVITYVVYEETYGTLPLVGRSIPITKQQCADVTIRSLSSVGHQVKDFSIEAIFENETYETQQMEPIKSGDSETAFISAGEKCNGKACFISSSTIVKIECTIDSLL